MFRPEPGLFLYFETKIASCFLKMAAAEICQEIFNLGRIKQQQPKSRLTNPTMPNNKSKFYPQFIFINMNMTGLKQFSRLLLANQASLGKIIKMFCVADFFNVATIPSVIFLIIFLGLPIHLFSGPANL